MRQTFPSQLERYRFLAAMTDQMASGCPSPGSRRLLLRIARSYWALAEQEEWLTGLAPPVALPREPAADPVSRRAA
jgi:hypothetical protein